MRISTQPSPIRVMIDQQHIENMEYFNCLVSLMTNDARRATEMKCRIAMTKEAFNKLKTLFISKLDWNLRRELLKCYTWSTAMCGAKIWTLRRPDKKYLGVICCRSNGEDKLERSCEKRRSITYSQGGKKYPIYNEKGEV